MIKTQLNFKTMVGDENSTEDDVAENIMAIHSALVHQLPGEEQNIKCIMLKLTMSAPVTIGALPAGDKK